MTIKCSTTSKKEEVTGRPAEGKGPSRQRIRTRTKEERAGETQTGRRKTDSGGEKTAR
jgi:hypothetical protein